MEHKIKECLAYIEQRNKDLETIKNLLMEIENKSVQIQVYKLLYGDEE